MEFIPKEYQPAVIDHIIEHQRCNAWVSMGGGKGVSVLTAADILWLAGSNLSPMLVMAPLRVARDVYVPIFFDFDLAHYDTRCASQPYKNFSSFCRRSASEI